MTVYRLRVWLTCARESRFNSKSLVWSESIAIFCGAHTRAGIFEKWDTILEDSTLFRCCALFSELIKVYTRKTLKINISARYSFSKKVCGFVDIEFNYQYKKNTYVKSRISKTGIHNKKLTWILSRDYYLTE